MHYLWCNEWPSFGSRFASFSCKQLGICLLVTCHQKHPRETSRCFVVGIGSIATLLSSSHGFGQIGQFGQSQIFGVPSQDPRMNEHYLMQATQHAARVQTPEAQAQVAYWQQIVQANRAAQINAGLSGTFVPQASAPPAASQAPAPPATAGAPAGSTAVPTLNFGSFGAPPAHQPTWTKCSRLRRCL